ncbi:MAG: metallophosphoesterase, partial [Hylemonella sp.]
AVALHGQVVNLSGVLLAGLGGHFVGRVWVPPAEPAFASKEAALNRGAYQYRGGQRPSPVYQGAIYPDDLNQLAKKRAHILITHEAPSCHPHGFEALDSLARELRAVRTFHGHHHDDRTSEYAKQREQLGFDAVALRFCQIKNGLGEEIFEGERDW